MPCPPIPLPGASPVSSSPLSPLPLGVLKTPQRALDRMFGNRLGLDGEQGEVQNGVTALGPAS